ncbi:hypothetical protein KFE25_012049 [Diacronema lutheri]|uniref:Uncharacterized protein n=1 Tax=Diacronema lutheri TaxID=2081491 RepID=A0A8J5XKI5_DIALT|nr:hypothetical protein KFE25_012049 [Diacronema lutheri]
MFAVAVLGMLFLSSGAMAHAAVNAAAGRAHPPPLRFLAGARSPDAVASSASGSACEDEPTTRESAQAVADALLEARKRERTHLNEEEAALAEAALHADADEMILDVDELIPDERVAIAAPSRRYHHADEVSATAKGRAVGDDEACAAPAGSSGNADAHALEKSPQREEHESRATHQQPNQRAGPHEAAHPASQRAHGR